MSVSITNTRFMQPFGDVIDFKVPKLTVEVNRGALITFIKLHPEDPEFKPVYGIYMDETPYNPAWVEVWHDGFRMVNTTLNFGATHTAYEVMGNLVMFKEPLLDGVIKIYADGPFYYDLPEYVIDINNVQGAATKNIKVGQVLASYFCEPVILTQPRNGFVRLTDDRKSLIYIPPVDWEGYDSFSYTVVSDRGQTSEPKCVFLTVGEPAGPTKDVPDDGSTDGATPATGG